MNDLQSLFNAFYEEELKRETSLSQSEFDARVNSFLKRHKLERTAPIGGEVPTKDPRRRRQTKTDEK